MESTKTEEMDSSFLQNTSQLSPDISLSSPKNTQLTFHLTNLSNFLQERKFTITSKLEEEDNEILIGKISEIINDLAISQNLPSFEMKSGSLINQSYRILSFTLYLLYKNFYDKDSNLILRNQNVQLKKRIELLTKKYDLLQNSSDIHSNSQINNLQSKKLSPQKYDDMCKEVVKLISYLKHHFNLSESTNLHNIIDAIHIQSTCRMTEEDRIEQLTVRNQDLENCLLSLQNENAKLEKELSENRNIISAKKKDDEYATNARIFVLQNDLNAMQIQMKNLSRKCEKRGEKIQNTAKIITEKDEENKKLKRDLDSLQIKYEQLVLESEESKQQNKNEIHNLITVRDQNDILNVEIAKLKSALDLLSTEYEKVNCDLTKETQAKNRIFDFIKKQNDALKVAEDQLEISNKNQKTFQQTQIKSTITRNLDDSFIDDCKQSLSKLSNPNSQEIESIMNNNSFDNHSKIIQVITTLVNDLTESQNRESTLSRAEKTKLNDFEQENNRLKQYISHLIDFLDHMSSSGELRDFFIESETKPDFKDKLLIQVSKLQSFIQEKGIYQNDTKEANHIDLSNYLQLVEKQIQNPDVEELMLLVRYSGFINDSLRRFADSINKQAESFLSEIKNVRNQLIEDKEKHEDELNELNENIKQEQQKTSDKNVILAQLQNILRSNLIAKENDDGKIEFIGKCLEIIKNGIDNNGEYSINSQEYIQEIESQLMREREIRDIFENRSKEEISRLKNEIEMLKKQGTLEKQLFIKEIAYAKKQLEELSINMKDSNKVKAEFFEKEKLIDSLETQLANKENEIHNINSQFEAEQERNQKEMEKLIKEKEEMKQSLSASLENVRAETDIKIKDVREEYKVIIKKLKNDIELETNRANDIRTHFENILKELNGKVQQANELEQNAFSKINSYEKELKAAKSEISKLNIDNKMLNLKIVTNDERSNRERLLLASQNNLNLLRVQTDHQNEINQIKEQYDNENYEFYLKICEIFKGYIDCTLNISKETIICLLNQVFSDLNKLNEKVCNQQRLQSQVCEIKTILHIENEKEIVQAISNLVNQTNCLNEMIQPKDTMKAEGNNIHQIESNLNIWEIWARKLCSIISGNVTVSKSSKEMQYAIEESLLSAIGQRQIWKKIEILRNEKVLLTSGIIKQKQKSEITCLSLIAVIVSISRLRKNCGNTLFEPDFSFTKQKS